MTGTTARPEKSGPMISQVDQAIPEKRIRRSAHLVPLALILGAVVAANLGGLLHLVTTNPLVLNADLAPAKAGWLPGLPYIDGNAGFTTQALGHVAVLDWFHGHIPWWNPYEAVGSPLAGEMQSGAFFPLTILLALHQGVFLLQLTLEVVTGWSTYFFVRHLGVGRSFSTAAGVAFGLCGTYAWLAHAPIRPVALLPLSLLGVERAVDAAQEHRRGGWRLLAVALALSILAGFPETSFIDGLFVVLWSILRMAGPDRRLWRPIMAKLAGGLAVGIALSAPLLVAFADYLPYGYVGGHGQGFAHVSLSDSGLSQLILPYSLGPIFGFHSTGGSDTISMLWGSVGGFLSVTVIAAGLVGLIGRRQRLLRLGLGGWILVCLLRTFGFPPVVHLMAALPGVRLTAFYRYSDGSWELAAVLLAALGLDDIARNVTRRRTMAAGTMITGALAVWAAAHAWLLMTHAAGSPGSRPHVYPLGSLATAGVALSILAIGGLMAGRRSHSAGVERISDGDQIERRRRRGRALMAGVVGAESMLLMGFTYLSAPPPTPLHLGAIEWLQAHLGAYRFLTLGPIQPNYGSYFGVAEASINDLPVPKAWNSYITDHLDPNALPGVFSGAGRINPAGPTAAQELTAHLTSYEAVGIRYVVESSSGLDFQDQPFPAHGSVPWPVGPRLVYHDGFAEIWELPSAAPVFSLRMSGDRRAAPGSCTVTGVGWDQAKVHCSRPSVLVRRVEFMPGWTASGNGVAMSVHKDRSFPGGLFQEVSLPAGTTSVQFTFLPPHEDLALVAALVALVVLLGSITAEGVWRRRGRHRGSSRRHGDGVRELPAGTGTRPGS